MRLILTLVFVFTYNFLSAQNYYYENYKPFDSKIPSPEEFLGYPIGENHTRHDRIVAYFNKLAEISDKVTIAEYGKTHEHRSLIMLTVTSEANQSDFDTILKKHLEIVNINTNVTDFSSQPVFVNLAYNVHGNEPSSAEAAMLTAYTLVASQSGIVKEMLDESVIFIDPTINPDGRDRHTNWVNSFLGNPKIADKYDIEHNETWPRGRTNHYWFDLNRDWYLAVNPESQGKLNWYHNFYPNVVTDFHEMGTNSTYFFEPMKANASKNPIMPKENYTKLNDLFANQFSEDLDKIGSLYFTKELFDGTYPGYGSSYPDLQGALALLFEQASSRGHLQETSTGEIEFAFTIRNQYTSSFATIKASIKNKEILHNYLQKFFTSAISNATKSSVKAYIFSDDGDKNRTQAFIDKLLKHNIEVYKNKTTVKKNNISFKANNSYIVPTKQAQYRMVQSVFETYRDYADSVYYDASSWSLVNFYNMPYAQLSSNVALGEKITLESNKTKSDAVSKSEYAYLIRWNDYLSPAVLYYLLDNKVVVKSAFKPFSIKVNGKTEKYGYGTLLIPVKGQKIPSDLLHKLITESTKKFNLTAKAVNTGFSMQGIDLGSVNFKTVKTPKIITFVGNGVSSYEAGEVWHLLDTRMKMPITKAPLSIFNRIDLSRYNTMVMVSGNYAVLDSAKKQRIKEWVKKGNTLITSRTASKWVIDQKLVKEQLVKVKKDTLKKSVERLNYVDAGNHIGKKNVGGAIFKIDLDITHPLGFGYNRRDLPVYRNSNVWLAPSKNKYSTIGKYTKNPHIDGYISSQNLKSYLIPSASLIVSPIGKGRVVMFADNPNFRGSWYGTNKLFMNAIFLGNHISIPKNTRGE